MEHNAQLIETMFEAVRESIENMAFMEVSRGGAQRPDELMWVSMTIEDPIKDVLYLGFPRPLLLQLTSSVFAMDPEEVQEQMLWDTLAELLNTLGGVFFNKILPAEKTYQLGLPVHGEGPFPKHCDSTYSLCMLLEEEPIILAAEGDGLSQL